jgi:3-dehydroquinate dehydratase / shikimate dehydrogenase
MSRPLLCATVTAPTMDELCRRRDAVRGADLVELRLDTVCDPNVQAALAGRATPVVVTCRPAWEGGQFLGSEDERRAILAEAIALGACYVDVEWRAGFTDLIRRRDGRGIVLSMHEFSGVPADLAERAAAMRSTGAEVIKIAVHATHLADCLPLSALARAAGSNTVVIGMGPAGLPTRVLAARFGSCWTYAGDAAPGQVPSSRLLGEFRFRDVSAETAVYGIAGAPIHHSLSPAMHNACFAGMGIDAVYLPLHTTSAGDFMAFAEAIGVKGASVTSPLKVGLADRMDRLDSIARRVGAINTVARSEVGWTGINTDVAGFLEPLAGRLDLANARAAILGAGGAARAVAAGLASVGAKVSVYARQPGRAAEVAALAGGESYTEGPRRGTWDVLVNATRVGTFPDVGETPIAGSCLDGRLVYDLVYNPAETRLMREAAAAGCETIGGLDMLVAQAQLQFAVWTGRRPPAGLMRQAALRRREEFAAESLGRAARATAR